MNGPAIALHALHCRFGAVQALAGVSLTLAGARCHVLLGGNGAGKTTLLRVLAGLVEPASGSATLDGQPVAPTVAAGRVFYLPEQFRPARWMRGSDFLTTMQQVLSLQTDAQARERTLAALDFPLDALQRPVSTYSKGMAQKLGLACALHSGRSLLLLDEPMSGLDPRARIALAALLRERSAAGCTVVLSAHSVSEAVQVSDSLWVFMQGRLRFGGSAQALAAAADPPDLLAAYLNVTAPEPA